MQLRRVSDQPILTPNKHVSWESDAVLNTAVIRHDGAVHLLYRAVSHPQWDPATRTGDYMSCIGYAISQDGENFDRLPSPVLPRETELDGFFVYDPRDPRVTMIEGTFYMTYCDWDLSTCQICLASSKDLRTWRNHGPIVPFADFGMNKNAGLFPERIGGRYAMIHRPEPRECLRSGNPFDWDVWSRDASCPGGMRLAFSDDMLHWTYEEQCIMLPRPGSWDCLKVGLAGPPMRTDKGWLVAYHGVDSSNVYRLGIALLDLEDPSIVLKRQVEPILEPELDWEVHGDIPGVVFSCGSFLVGSELWIYYGGGDTVIGAAKGDITGFLANV